MLTFKIKDIYDRNFNRKLPATSSMDVLVLHQQKDQRTGCEKRRSIIRKNRRMVEIINIARKNLATGKIIKVNLRT